MDSLSSLQHIHTDFEKQTAEFQLENQKLMETVDQLRKSEEQLKGLVKTSSKIEDVTIKYDEEGRSIFQEGSTIHTITKEENESFAAHISEFQKIQSEMSKTYEGFSQSNKKFEETLQRVFNVKKELAIASESFKNTVDKMREIETNIKCKLDELEKHQATEAAYLKNRANMAAHIQ